VTRRRSKRNKEVVAIYLTQRMRTFGNGGGKYMTYDRMESNGGNSFCGDLTININ